MRYRSMRTLRDDAIDSLLNTAGSCGCEEGEGGGVESKRGGTRKTIFWCQGVCLCSHSSSESVMVTREGIEGSQLHPASAQLLGCVPAKTTDISTHLEDAGYTHPLPLLSHITGLPVECQTG